MVQKTSHQALMIKIVKKGKTKSTCSKNDDQHYRKKKKPNACAPTTMIDIVEESQK